MLFNPKKGSKVTVCIDRDNFGMTGKISSIDRKAGFRGYKYNVINVVLSDGNKESFKEWELSD